MEKSLKHLNNFCLKIDSNKNPSMTDRFKKCQKSSRSAVTNPNTPYQVNQVLNCDDLLATKEKVSSFKGYAYLISPTPLKKFNCGDCDVDKPVKRKPLPSGSVEKFDLLSQKTSLQMMLEGDKGPEFYVLKDLSNFEGLSFDEKLDRSHNDNDCRTQTFEVVNVVGIIQNEILEWLDEKEKN